MSGKLLIFSAPSGSGKTTIVKHLLKLNLGLEFSISATSRNMRNGETDGKDYHFLSSDDFAARIDKDEFVEWEEVYKGCYYGTLKSELERIWSNGNHVVFDVDVVGGVNLKKIFGDKALSLFVQAPSVEELENRLKGRGTDSDEEIAKRIDKAKYEMTFAKEFDTIIVNDNLEKAYAEAEKSVRSFLEN
ncbi:MAG: guanylate kinase [Bacteroidales bacterium]|jgi:guanylate kinase|nr:guanylate kinase [Bacteroidales bacterium]